MYQCDSCNDMALHLAPGDGGLEDALILCASCLADYQGDPAALERLRAQVLSDSYL